MMAKRFVRRNVWKLGGDWADPILWYARGVAAMKARPLATQTSWRFYAAIHGIDTDRWRELGYLSPADTLPNDAAKKDFWDQCQHGSWFFLPWHRGYLLAFEKVVRDAVVKAGGPADWALPYWNYFKPGQSVLPPAFASPAWPDGKGDNPLFVEERFGPRGDGKVFVDRRNVNLDAMTVGAFTGVATGGDPGFGGVDTGGFHHGGGTHGRLESQPHDMVHVLVGGPRMRPGLMSRPSTAGLDPIFWLHHANIDRLWEVWRRNPPATHFDPTEISWLDHPVQADEQGFVLPRPDGTPWRFTSREVTDMAALGYDYDDLSAGEAVDRLQERRVRIAEGAGAAAAEEEVPVARDVELVGTNDGSLSVGGDEVRTSVRLDTGVRNKVSASLVAGAEGGEPDRIFLNLQNVRASVDGAILDVYVGPPAGPTGEEQPERRAGSVALFGAEDASRPDGRNAGAGLTFVLDVTDIVEDLHLSSSFDLDALSVRIVPEQPAPDDAPVSIGQVSLFRQGH